LKARSQTRAQATQRRGGHRRGDAGVDHGGKINDRWTVHSFVRSFVRSAMVRSPVGRTVLPSVGTAPSRAGGPPIRLAGQAAPWLLYASDVRRSPTAASSSSQAASVVCCVNVCSRRCVWSLCACVRACVSDVEHGTQNGDWRRVAGHRRSYARIPGGSTAAMRKRKATRRCWLGT
jgi:hypothetical protein